MNSQEVIEMLNSGSGNVEVIDENSNFILATLNDKGFIEYMVYKKNGSLFDLLVKSNNLKYAYDHYKNNITSVLQISKSDVVEDEYDFYKNHIGANVERAGTVDEYITFVVKTR
jgi:hypothetical protein